MTKPTFLPLLGALLACNGIMLQAQAAEDPAQRQLQQQELSNAIQRQILTMDVNHQEKYLIDFYFSTFHGMYAYREMLLWAQAAPQQQRDDLMALTRSGLEAVVRDSGMGIPLSSEKGRGPAAGLLFSKGLPRYTVQPDFAQTTTLKWNPATFDRQVAPESVGQSLAAKSLYIQSDTSDEGKNIRELMLVSVINEFQTLLPLLELGGDKSASYMPALLKLENDKWTVVNASSQIYGQMSLIQGLVRLHALLSLSKLENETIAGKRATEWRKEVRRALEKVYQTTVKLHLDSNSGSFIGSHDRLKGASDRLAAEEAGYILDVLADFAATLPNNDPLRAGVLARLSAQADYLVARLEGKTSVPKTFLIKSNQTYAGFQVRLDDQLAIINGLLAAKQVTAKEQYGKTALAMFNAIHKPLWSNAAGILRSAVGQTVSAYDGHLFGLTLATWRRLEQLLAPGEARQHGDKFIEVVLKQGGLQIAEGPATGEPKQPEAFIQNELPELVTSIVALKKEEQPGKISATLKAMSDQDGDGIPGCRFAAKPFGAAPVIITQTSVKTPFDPPPVATDTPATATPPTTPPPRSTP